MYFKKNKVKAVRHLLHDTRLGRIKLEMTKEKIRDKIGNIIIFYQTWKNKMDKIKLGLDIIYHDQVIENIKENIIQKVLIYKCFWYL